MGNVAITIKCCVCGRRRRCPDPIEEAHGQGDQIATPQQLVPLRRRPGHEDTWISFFFRLRSLRLQRRAFAAAGVALRRVYAQTPNQARLRLLFSRLGAALNLGRARREGLLQLQ